MLKHLWILPCALLAIPALCAGQDVAAQTCFQEEFYLCRKVG